MEGNSGQAGVWAYANGQGGCAVSNVQEHKLCRMQPIAAIRKQQSNRRDPSWPALRQLNAGSSHVSRFQLISAAPAVVGIFFPIVLSS